jgi:hypothetical protein
MLALCLFLCKCPSRVLLHAHEEMCKTSGVQGQRSRCKSKFEADVMEARSFIPFA